jgi:hypothetical protein
MNTRVWLRIELASALAFAIPTFVSTKAGAQHVAAYGPWIWYVFSPFMILFWGPAPLLVVAVILQARQRFERAGWILSAVVVVLMSFWSVVALLSFSRQSDVHWILWTMWIVSGMASIATVAGVSRLAPSRRLASVRPAAGPGPQAV